MLVIGPRWDQYNLTPWVYDFETNTWSNKLTPDGKTLPSLPDEMLDGSATLIKNKVYMCIQASVLILDLSTLDGWYQIQLPQFHGNNSVIVPFSPTEIAIIGGQ